MTQCLEQQDWPLLLAIVAFVAFFAGVWTYAAVRHCYAMTRIILRVFLRFWRAFWRSLPPADQWQYTSTWIEDGAEDRRANQRMPMGGPLQ